MQLYFTGQSGAITAGSSTDVQIDTSAASELEALMITAVDGSGSEIPRRRLHVRIEAGGAYMPREGTMINATHVCATAEQQAPFAASAIRRIRPHKITTVRVYADVATNRVDISIIGRGNG